MPYKGTALAVNDLLGGQIQASFVDGLSALKYVKAGSLRAIGVSTRERNPTLAEVPTIAEQGVPGYESGTWQGVRVARGTPEAIVQRLNKELIAVIRTADIRSRLAGQGAEVVTMTPAEEERFFDKERARWAKVVADASIKLD